MARRVSRVGGERDVIGGRLAGLGRREDFSVTVEALASVVEPGEIAQVLEETGKWSRRIRKLPAQLVVWLVIGMALFRELSISNVLLRLVHGLGMRLPWTSTPEQAPQSRSVTRARDRLGFEVIRRLFRQLSQRLAVEHEQQNMWRGHALYGIDGTTFTVPDTEDNEAHFGRPGSNRGRSGYPQFRGVFLVALWSHIVRAAAFSPLRNGELHNAYFLLDHLPGAALLLGDRLYYAFGFLAGVVKRQGHFLIRAKTGKRDMKFRRRGKLGNGDWLAVLRVPDHLRKKRTGPVLEFSCPLPEFLTVRVVRYQRRGFRASYLVTTLLDPEVYPAEELVLLYHGRWEVELCYAEVKTRFIKERVVFRCQRYERVLQEAYGLLIAYNCVRTLMARAALKAGVEPRQLSFTDCLVRIREAVIVMGLSPGVRLLKMYRELIEEMARCVLPPRRSERVYPRAVKVKMSGFPLKREVA
jgi:hypothetical protein